MVMDGRSIGTGPLLLLLLQSMNAIDRFSSAPLTHSVVCRLIDDVPSLRRYWPVHTPGTLADAKTWRPLTWLWALLVGCLVLLFMLVTHVRVPRHLSVAVVTQMSFL